MKNIKIKTNDSIKMACFLLILLVSNSSNAQRDLKSESKFTPVYGLIYKGDFSGGDFAKRWGYTNTLGLEANFKLKNNLTFGLESHFLFGNTFKDSAIFKNLYNSDGEITSGSGFPADVIYFLRGAAFTGQIGYVFNQLGGNANSGLWVNFGLGYMVHKIRIENHYDKVDQFEGDLIKGYDKLTMGVTTKQFIGYLHQSNKRFLNFYGGFEFMQGYTKNVRNYNFDTEGPENELRLDLFYGFKVGWMIPIYQGEVQKYYFD